MLFSFHACCFKLILYFIWTLNKILNKLFIMSKKIKETLINSEKKN